MAKKRFSFNEVNKKIDVLYNMLDNGEVRISDDYNSLDKLNEIYDLVDDLEHKLGRLRGAFRRSVADVIDQKQNEIFANAVLTLPAEDLVKFQKQVKARNDKLHEIDNGAGDVESQSTTPQENYDAPIQNDQVQN